MYEMNPWWETEQVPRELIPPHKRELFGELARSINRRFIDLIVGLRRTGKTTLIFQLIDHLLKKGVNPKALLYFSFDERSMDLKEIIREYEEKILRARLREKPAYIFLDEIHKLTSWSEKLKLLYDLNPKTKFLASGSASLNLMRGARESLAGRCVFHRLEPLTLAEYLRLKGEQIPPLEDFELFERRVAIMYQDYLRKGFPEIVHASDREAERYVKELVLERVVYRDIPESFRADDIELLKLLAELICSNPGMILNVDSLSRDLGRARKTVRNYLQYLELTFVIRRLNNLRGPLLASSRKNRRGYPYHPCLSAVGDDARMAETAVASEIGARYYWRLRGLEVDFILKDGKPLPIEVKYKPKIGKRDLKGISAFQERFRIKQGLVITKVLSEEHRGLRFVPLLQFLLYEKKLLAKP
jgi:hypothetical protein